MKIRMRIEIGMGMGMKAQIRNTIVLFIMMLFLNGCVNQHPEGEGGMRMAAADISTDTIETMLEITDPQEEAAVKAAKAMVQSMDREPRIIATSPAAAEICNRLELNLAGICSSTASALPERYQDVPTVGTAMSPDMEIVSSLNPDWILSPASLQTDLQPKYEEIDTQWAFLNLRSVQGMYRSIQELGEIFGREEQAMTLVDEFTEFYEEYQRKNEGQESPKVLILMGLPASYIIATENSYVGNLVALAGGENVYAGSSQEFLTVNTEDMKAKEPDIILRAAHALPDQVAEMFQEDFKTNDIWKHFKAVENGRVFDLTYELFGMSATFRYPEALEELQPLLYPASGAAAQKTTETSALAPHVNETSSTAKKGTTEEAAYEAEK